MGDVDASLFSEMEIAKSGFSNQLMSDFLQKEDVQEEIHERALRLLEARFFGKGGRVMYISKNRNRSFWKMGTCDLLLSIRTCKSCKA